MKITENKIAEKSIPSILQKMMPDESAEDIDKLSDVIIDDFYKYGYQSKKIITDARLQAFKNFLPIADKFFDNLNTTVQIAVTHNEKRYDKIVDFVLACDKIPPKDKIKLYITLEKKKDKREKEWLKKIMPLAFLLSATMIIIFANPKVAIEFIKGIVKIIKELSKGTIKIIKIITKAVTK